MERRHGCSPALLAANDDLLIKEILRTHSPDDRRIDPRPHLHLTESILNCIKMLNVHKSITVEASVADDEHGGVGIASSMDKELVCTIHKLSYEMSKNRYTDVDKHGATMAFLELLGCYSWDVKVVAVLAALVLNYGQFCLIRQLYRGQHPLASSIEVLKGLTITSECSLEMTRCFRALDLLVHTLLDVVRCIVELGCLALGYVPVEQEEMQALQPSIHSTVYWVIRTSVVCTWQLTSIMTERQTSLVLATWELWSYVCKVKDIQKNMRKGLDFCYVRSKETVQSLFEKTQADNQKVLSKFLAQNHAPILRCGSSAEKIDVSALEKKVVMLLISSPNVSREKLLLVQQSHNRPGKEVEGKYEIVWIPIPGSMSCSPPEEISFKKLADAMPWYSVCYPWLLSRSIIEYINEKWLRQDELVMVVLGSKGEILSLNATDMVLIWGPKAYPFSNLRERELWDGARWTLELLMDEIDPHVSHLMADGRIVCLYGSKDVDWIRELNEKTKPMAKAGIQLFCVYAGSRSAAHTIDVLHLIYYEKLSYCLTRTSINMFWSRLDSMQRSRLRVLGCNSETDAIMSRINSLTRLDAESQSWAMISEGPSGDSSIMLNGGRILELFSLFEAWGRDVETMGFLGAVRHSLDPPSPAGHCGNCSVLVPFYKASGITTTCEVCGGPMEKHIVYQCSTTR